MIETLRDIAVRHVFGGGIPGSLVEKGIDWLVDETRSAIGAEPESLDTVRLSPGETFTVLARPPATKRERKLAKKAEALSRTEAKLARPTARQKRAARALARAQGRLDRRRAGTRRHRDAVAVEARLARRFDRVMVPSKKLANLRAELARANRALERERAANLRAARRGRVRSESTTVYT